MPEKADPTEHSWRGVLRGHVPSKSPSADGEIPVPMLPGTRRKGQKAAAFRGRNGRAAKSQEQAQKSSCRDKTHRIRVPEKAAPTEHSWRGVLRGHVPSKSPSADGEIPVPMLPGTGRRWVRKAIAFRGRSEQDRSALCPACSTATLETFRWNVSNGMCPDANLRTRHAVSLQKIAGCFLCRWESVCNFPPGHCKNQAFPLWFHTGSGLVRSPQKAIAFCPFLRAPEAWRREFRCLRTAT